MHAQLFNDTSLLYVQKFSIDFSGCNRDNFPNYYCVTLPHGPFLKLNLRCVHFPTLSTDLFSSQSLSVYAHNSPEASKKFAVMFT